jgi:hypothetical protein
VAAAGLYDALMAAVIRTSIIFFEKNSVGRIVNKFGKVFDSDLSSLFVN